MTREEYREAAAIFPRLIRSHLNNPSAGKIADAFQSHFSRITSAHDFSRDFEVWKLYCIHFRRTYWQNSSKFSPADLHVGLWEWCSLQLRTKDDSVRGAQLSTIAA